MLLLAILLLLAAVGLLVDAVVTSQLGLAWVSVGVSALAAMAVLLWRRRARRRQKAAEDAAGDTQEPAAGDTQEPGDTQDLGDAQESEDTGDEVIRHDEGAEDGGSAVAVQDAEPPAPVPSPAEGPAEAVLGPGPGSNEVADADSENDGTADPAEEHTEAADLLVVFDSSDEVLVVDEQPRYHLPRCRWPDPAKTERLPVREARELGFTPCDRCRPDVEIARRQRPVPGESVQEQPKSGARSV